jgi:hypothetical protein
VLRAQSHVPIFADQFCNPSLTPAFLPPLTGQFQRQPQCLNKLR